MQGKTAVEKVKEATGNQSVVLEVADVGDLASLQAFASKYEASGQPLHVLINSAGIMARTPQTAPLSATCCSYTAEIFLVPRLLCFNCWFTLGPDVACLGCVATGSS